MCYTIGGRELCDARGRHGAGPHRAGPRRRGLHDRPAGRAASLLPVFRTASMTRPVPEWLRGVDMWTADDQVAERLRASSHLF